MASIRFEYKDGDQVVTYENELYNQTWSSACDSFLTFLRGCGFVIGYNYHLEPVCDSCNLGMDQHDLSSKCPNDKFMDDEIIYDDERIEDIKEEFRKLRKELREG